MINNDSVVTAYDEHLTLVEWLQKVEVLLKNGGLKEVALNDKGNGSQYNKALFSLTLTFNDGTKIESNDMALKSVNEALNNLNGDINTNAHRIEDLEYEVDYHGFDMTQPFDKDNCVRIGSEFSTEEWTLKRTYTVLELSDEDASKVKTILLKAIKYGFVAYDDAPEKSYNALISAFTDDTSIYATFALKMSALIPFSIFVVYLTKESGTWKYSCINKSL